MNRRAFRSALAANKHMKKDHSSWTDVQNNMYLHEPEPPSQKDYSKSDLESKSDKQAKTAKVSKPAKFKATMKPAHGPGEKTSSLLGDIDADTSSEDEISDRTTSDSSDGSLIEEAAAEYVAEGAVEASRRQPSRAAKVRNTSVYIQKTDMSEEEELDEELRSDLESLKPSALPTQPESTSVQLNSHPLAPANTKAGHNRPNKLAQPAKSKTFKPASGRQVAKAAKKLTVEPVQNVPDCDSTSDSDDSDDEDAPLLKPGTNRAKLFEDALQLFPAKKSKTLGRGSTVWTIDMPEPGEDMSAWKVTECTMAPRAIIGGVKGAEATPSDCDRLIGSYGGQDIYFNILKSNVDNTAKAADLRLQNILAYLVAKDAHIM